MSTMARPRTFGCGVEVSLELLGGKWKPVILARIKDGALRYGELRRLIPRLSDKVLTERLRELEAQGLVERRLGEESQGSVSYALTERAAALRPALEALYAWGEASARDLGWRIAEPALQ